MHVDQCRACIDLMGYATSDGAVHVLSYGYQGRTPTAGVLVGPRDVKEKKAAGTSTTMTNAASWCACETTSMACTGTNGSLRIVDRSTFCSGDIVA